MNPVAWLDEIGKPAWIAADDRQLYCSGRWASWSSDT